MAFSAKVLADSMSPAGHRLTTLEVTVPRIVLAEFNTHRMFSRSSASSRAIPVEKRILGVELDPFIPEAFGKNQKGMQAQATLEESESEQAREIWTDAMGAACDYARALAKLGVHKQLANRLIEPFCWHTVIVTATEWGNFWGLRISKYAQPEIAKPASMMNVVMSASTPQPLNYHEWHTPLTPDRIELFEAGFTWLQVARISAARCARVSYLTHDGKRDPAADLELYERLVEPGHMAPLEHVATPNSKNTEHDFVGNFCGWFQLRKTIPNERDFSLRLKE